MLADLDELVHQCRSQRAEQYVGEAVAAYKVGAFRSCIVSTWIAVVFDVIDKLRELDRSGDAFARQKLSELERHRRNQYILGLLEFERGILDTAKDALELLTPIQHDDLKRLHDDRNRCAHPTLLNEEDPYSPSAELARYHLRMSVQHLLSQPPVHGRAIVAQLAEEVESEYFPRSVDMAERHLRDSQLLRARPALIRNFIIVLLKVLLLEDSSNRRQARHLAALNATRRVHPGPTDAVLQEQIPILGRRLQDHELFRLPPVIQEVPVVFEFLGDTVTEKVRKFVDHPPPEHAGPVVRIALHIPELKHLAMRAIRRMSDDTLAAELNHDPISTLTIEGVDRFAKSKSFSEANERGKNLVLPFVPAFAGPEARKLRETILKNDQVRGSFMATRIVQAIAEADEEAVKSLSENEENADRLVDLADWRTFYCELCRGPLAVSGADICQLLAPKLPDVDCGSSSAISSSV